MDVNKIMAEERATAEAERGASQSAWASVCAAVKSVPGIRFDQRLHRASVARSHWIGTYHAELWVRYYADVPVKFPVKDWEQAVELFVRNVARDNP